MKDKISQVVVKVHEYFKSRGLKLSIAESCTGGLLSHYLTSLSGASEFFQAGIIAYSEEIKKNILGVSPETIKKYGVVSEETAREMAEKVLALSKTDYAVSTTGNLGPDVLEGKDRGLICIAASGMKETISRELRLRGSREENNEAATFEALKLLIELLKEEEAGEKR
ncbi:MAG: CinA family protein [Nitrospiraceae bacterium]|nr:MAG: CinA family protein [Nitrospiraceae bacterium]